MRKILLLLLLASSLAFAGTSSRIPHAVLMTPHELSALLSKKSGKSGPVVIHVGFDWQYRTGHIPGARHLGPASEAKDLALLRAGMKDVSRTREIVIYCGCCPFKKCPNVYPALMQLKKMGFKHIRVVHIAHNFKKDWIDPGYPVTRK